MNVSGWFDKSRNLMSQLFTKHHYVSYTIENMIEYIGPTFNGEKLL